MTVQSSIRGYSERDISGMLGVSVRQIRSFAEDGLFSSAPTDDGLLSFEDVVLLRAAKELVDSHLSPRRVRLALRKLRSQLPEDKPLSSVRLCVERGEIVVSDGGESWEPESGQVVLDLRSLEEAVDGDERSIPEVGASAPEPPVVDEGAAQEWYEQGCDLEESGVEAREAYLRALDADPSHLDSHLNLGRLLHEAHDFRGAESHYRSALEICPKDPTAAFNLGVVLEDIGLRSAAIEAYERAIDAEPSQVDAYHNAVRLYEESGDKASAVRVLKRLRGLNR